LRTCPNCTTELVVDGGEHCPVCNALLTSDAPHGTPNATDDDMRFEVTEAHDDPRDLVGGAKRQNQRDDLGIEREADIMAGQTRNNRGTAMSDVHSKALDDEQVPMHSAAPPPTPAQQQTAAGAQTPEDKNGMKRLSAKEVESISKNLYGNQTYLSEREKLDLLRKVDPNAKPNAGGPAQSGESAEQDPLRPRMAKRVRGVAWYYRNWIQIVGEQDLHEHEEIMLNDRPYVLRKKRFSPKVVIAAVAPIAAVLLFFLASVLTPSMTGKGRIVGFVIGQDGQPYLQSATVRLPETGQTLTTNAQGFFVSDPIKSGSHKVEYVVNGQVIGSDYATVVANEVTTLKLAPTSQQVASTQTITRAPVTTAPSQEIDRRPAPERPTQREAAPQQASTGQNARVSADPNARLQLDANIEGATLALNGKVVGAGNMTYSRLAPGRYDYQVSKVGYQTSSGVIELVAGKTTGLAAQLYADKTPPRPTVAVEEQHYRTATTALAAGDLPTAETEFQAAIDAKPSYAAAHLGLGDLRTKMGRRTEASENYLRAAEIYRVAGDLGNSLKSYNSAVQTDKTSVAALLGRGNLYMSRGEEIAAVADFEAVIGLDRRNFQAYYGLGQARFSQGNAKAAIKHFKDARSLDPKNAETYQYLMLCYFADDNLKEAKKAYESFKEIATADQLSQLQQSNKFSAVLRVVQE
jgi:Tfp pilus assembly protein PilF